MKNIKRIVCLLLCILMIAAFAACKDNDVDSGKKPGNNSSEQGYTASALPGVVKGSITFKKYGTVTFELYPKTAPESALNFIYLANSGHFNGVIVDRLQKDFVIQAGKYESGYLERKTDFDYTIKGEFAANGIENPLTFVKGTMAWVLSGEDYNSASTEFAIYTDATTCYDLNGKYAAFGSVIGEDSFKVLKKINKQKTYSQKPVEEIMITSVVIDPVDLNGFEPTYKFPEPNFIKADAKKDNK